MRPLTSGERALARGVFGEALGLERIRIGRAPFGPFAVTLGRHILFPGRPPADFAAEPLDRRAWLIHELTHAWQFQTAARWTLASWAKTLATGGYGPGLPGYGYAHPFEWASLNLEQQARVVEHAYLLREEGDSSALEAYAGRTPFLLLPLIPAHAGTQACSADACAEA